MEIRTAHTSLKDALALGPPPAGTLAVPVFAKGSLTVELYSPRGRDAQEPHVRDEVYVVARGHALFWNGNDTESLEPGSFVYVAAGQEHRFESFSDDFAVWVMFYGPDGGES